MVLVQKIASMIRRSERTISSYVNAYKAKGLSG
ncbi:terminase gpP N-terminus-related DNA-binding protein, partial [Escherichia sp. R-CC3]